RSWGVLSRALRNGSIAPDGRSALCQTPAMTTGGGRRTAMHANRSRSVLAGCAAVAIAGLAAGGAWADDALGSAYDAKSAGTATLTVWWLGNQEIPGIEDWMKESIAKYQQANP